MLPFFPTIGGDSWITIGLDSQNTGDEVAISVVEDSDQPFVAAFQSGSAIDGADILLNTQTGGAWYVLNGTPNGLPDADGRVLVMQMTTSGGFSGTLNVQIFGNGIGDNDIRKTFTYDGVGTFNAAGEGKAAAVPAETLVVVRTMQRQTMILQRNMTMEVVSTAFQAARMRRLVTMMQTRQTTTAHAWLWTSAVYAAVTALPTALAIATATVLQQATTVMATA